MSVEIKTFNHVLCRFVSSLVDTARRIETTGDAESREIRLQIQTMQTAMSAALFADPAYMITRFFDAVEPYHSHIFDKDESFFLHHTISEVETDCVYTKKIQHIRELWNSGKLTDAEKTTVWTRLSQLMRLSALHVNDERAQAVRAYAKK